MNLCAIILIDMLYQVSDIWIHYIIFISSENFSCCHVAFKRIFKPWILYKGFMIRFALLDWRDSYVKFFFKSLVYLFRPYQDLPTVCTLDYFRLDDPTPKQSARYVAVKRLLWWLPLIFLNNSLALTLCVLGIIMVNTSMALKLQLSEYHCQQMETLVNSLFN